MNITNENSDEEGKAEIILDERYWKLGRSLVIGTDVEFVGEPEMTEEGLMYKFIAISEKSKKYFKKVVKDGEK